jgi:hypothetical protein
MPAAVPATLATLATDLKTAWTAPTTDARVKKRIMRALIHEVAADNDDAASEIVLTVHWVGWRPRRVALAKTPARAAQRPSTR